MKKPLRVSDTHYAVCGGKNNTKHGKQKGFENKRKLYFKIKDTNFSKSIRFI